MGLISPLDSIVVSIEISGYRAASNLIGSVYEYSVILCIVVQMEPIRK
jgi:hypothetical protein